MGHPTLALSLLLTVVVCDCKAPSSSLLEVSFSEIPSPLSCSIGRLIMTNDYHYVTDTSRRLAGGCPTFYVQAQEFPMPDFFLPPEPVTSLTRISLFRYRTCVVFPTFRYQPQNDSEYA